MLAIQQRVFMSQFLLVSPLLLTLCSGCGRLARKREEMVVRNVH